MDKGIVSLIEIITAIIYISISFLIIKEDLSTGKIKNKKILLLLKLISIILSIHIINSVLGYLKYSNSYLNFQFYKLYIINLLYAIVSGYILWYGEIWPAGDAKYYMVSLTFIPVITERLTGYPNYTWLLVLINIFIISAIFSITVYLKENFTLLGHDIAFKEIKEFFKLEKIKISSNMVIDSFSVFSIFILKQFFNILFYNYIFNIFHRTDIIFFLLFFLWPKFSEFFKTKSWKIAIIIIYIIIFIYFSINNGVKNILWIVMLKALKNTILFGGIFFVGKEIFERIIEKKSIYWLGYNEIKEGMVLSTKELKIIRNIQEFKELFKDVFKDGLTKEQADALNEWLKRHPNKNAKIEFIKTKPFSYAIFIGVVFYIITSNSILKFLLK